MASSHTSVAHVVLANPYGRMGRGNLDGFVPKNNVLKLHLWSLAQLPSRLAAVLLVMPTKPDAELPGYAAVDEEARLLPCSLHVLRVANNSLGSYGMFLHAFAAAPIQYAYYIMSEVDYLPVRSHFDSLLVALYEQAFGSGGVGALVGVLQGEPVEGRAMSRLHQHAEGPQIMSAAAMRRVFDFVYAQRRWQKSVSDRMVSLVVASGGAKRSSGRWDHIQEGFGMLLAESGVPSLDFSAAFRSPYWNHHEVIDWTGAVAAGGDGAGSTLPVLPMNRLLFAPVQLLMRDTVRRCCALSFSACKQRKTTCIVRNWRTDDDCCAVMRLPAAVLSAARHANFTLNATQVSAAERDAPTGGPPISASFPRRPPAQLTNEAGHSRVWPRGRGAPSMTRKTTATNASARSRPRAATTLAHAHARAACCADEPRALRPAVV